MPDYACKCSVDVDDDARYEPCLKTRPKARKPHRCCECGELINIGETYEQAKGLLAGQWDTFRTCIPCVNMRDDLCPGGHFYEYLGDTIRECLGWSPYEVPDFDEEES